MVVNDIHGVCDCSDHIDDCDAGLVYDHDACDIHDESLCGIVEPEPWQQTEP
jgi:hypothetical protein